ncbi:MAG TPA: hypothetical protein VFO41_05690, partial [Alphaproteobacteria bacterium]|nr:hypothetical protein [Alphaproteobacteria bacterium]
MRWHVVMLSVALSASATSAFADCAQEITELEERYKGMEGASTSAAPTEHQAQALGTGEGSGATATT